MMDPEDFILGLCFVEVTIELELFVFFILGWRREARKAKFDIITFLGLYFLCLAIGRMILIANDFPPANNNFLYLSGVGLSLLGMVFFIHLAEIIIPKNTHHIFTLLSCATLLSIFFVGIPTAKNILYAMLPLIFLIGFIFLGYLIHQTIGSVRTNFILVFIGQWAFGFGQGFNTDLISDWFTYEVGFDIQPIGLILIIGGLGLIAIAFWRLPSFSEIEWHSKMVSLFVITNEHGICCVHFPFRKYTGKMSPQLVSSGVSGVITIVKEMTSSKKHLKYVDQEDVKLIFEYGLYTTAALLAEEDLEIYHAKLKRFLDEFESEFIQYLINWTGSIQEFEPAMQIITRIFEYPLPEGETLSDPEKSDEDT
jgi:hypothetical protein